MNFEFIRMLVKEVPDEHLDTVITSLTAANLEVYAKTGEGSYKHTVDSGDYEDHNIYVSAADMEHAKQIVDELGFGRWICSPEESVVVKSELQRAQEEFVRKQKRQQVLCLILMAAVAVYWVIKALIH